MKNSSTSQENNLEKKPEGFESDLGPYGPQVFDGYSGEPIGWGFPILRYLGDQRFEELGNHGNKHCIYPNWYLIVKWLTHEEAVKKYGPLSDLELGPQGGFRSITYGKTKFISRMIYNLYQVSLNKGVFSNGL